MTNRLSLHVVVTYMGLLYAVGLRCWVEGVPAAGETGGPADSEFMADKIEIFKRDILNRLGYERTPDVSNITQNIEEKRRMIQKYRKYIEERDMAFSDKDLEEDTENNVKSRTFYSVQYEGKNLIHGHLYCFFQNNAPFC